MPHAMALRCARSVDLDFELGHVDFLDYHNRGWSELDGLMCI